MKQLVVGKETKANPEQVTRLSRKQNKQNTDNINGKRYTNKGIAKRQIN